MRETPSTREDHGIDERKGKLLLNDFLVPVTMGFPHIIMYRRSLAKPPLPRFPLLSFLGVFRLYIIVIRWSSTIRDETRTPSSRILQ